MRQTPHAASRNPRNLVRTGEPDLVRTGEPDCDRTNRKKPKPKTEDDIAARPDLNVRYSMIPGTLIADCSRHRLNGDDILVFAALSFFAIKSDKASHSTRWIAEQTGLRRNRVLASLRRLRQWKHIEAVSGDIVSRRRVCWRLTSPIFGRQQKVAIVDRDGVRMTNRASLTEQYRHWKEKTA